MNTPRVSPLNRPFKHPGYTLASGGVDARIPDDEIVDLRQLLQPLWRRKWVVIATMLVFVGLATVAVVHTENRYTAYARVIFEPERLRLVQMDSVIVQPEVGEGLQNQIEMLRSHVLMDRVVEQLRLADTPEFNSELRSEPYPFVERLLAEVATSKALETILVSLRLASPSVNPVLTKAEEEANLRAGIVSRLSQSLSLVPVPDSRVIELRFTSTNPALAASIVNAIAEQYIFLQTEAKREELALAGELLRARVEDLEDRLTTSKEAVEDARLQISLQDGLSAELTRGQLEAASASLASLRLTRADLERRHDRAATTLASNQNLWHVTEFRDSPIIQDHRLSESRLLDEIAAMTAIVGESQSDPKLVRMQARVAETRRKIREEAESIVAALNSDLAAISEQEAELSELVRGLEIRTSHQARSELRLEQLEREALANQTIYESFLGRMKETTEQANLQTSDARFLARAEPPQSPDTNSRLRVVLLAGLGGILAGFGIVFLLERLNETFQSLTDVEAHTGYPMLAAIPKSRDGGRLNQLVQNFVRQPSSTLAEAVRNLRTSILLSSIDQPPKVVMFTSSLPFEGKTTTAMLVAVTIHQMGYSAIIVDCDFRRKSIAQMRWLGARQERSGAYLPERPGLAALLSGRVAMEDAVLIEPESGLHVLTQSSAETLIDSPADVLSSQRFAALIDALRARYDVVILDTPPLLVAADARILARLADAVIYLVRWNSTKRSAVYEGLRELALVNAQVAGFAFTMVNESAAAGYSGMEFFRDRYYAEQANA